MKTTTLRLPDELYEKIWKIHVGSRKSINSIILDLIGFGFEGLEEVHQTIFKKK